MKRITLERRIKGLSQTALSRKAEMHPSSVSAIESGRLQPWPGQVRKLAEALGWPENRAEELFEEVDTP